MPAETGAALEGFLRGVRVRARLFVHWQSGDPGLSTSVLASAEARFRQEAPLRPLADWPRLFWRSLLDVPELRLPPQGPQFDIPPGIARLAHGPRALLLLGLAAELDDATAAQVLGTPLAGYRLAREQLLPVNQLGRPDMDVWQAWHAAALRAQAPAEPPLPGRPAHVPLAAGADSPPPEETDLPPRRGVLVLLWLGVLACAAALAATFLWTPPPALSARLHGEAVRIRALGAAAGPRARMDASEGLCLHPERLRLERPALEPVVTALAFHAWFAARLDAATRAGLPVIDVGLVQMPAQESLQACRARLQALPAAERDQLQARIAAFDALPPVARRAPRERWQAWWALTDEERQRVLQAAAAFAALPGDARAQALQAFRALPAQAQTAWRLGPALGADVVGLQPLLLQVPPAQREPLLAALRGLSPEERALLVRIAAGTSPEQRTAVRETLLALPVHQRGNWLRRQLAQ